MSRRYPDWVIEGKDWPNCDVSGFVEADGYRWHVQDMVCERPDAPVCVLIHGTGAATHSWRDMMPILAKHYRVIAMDLPGHGFTRPNHARRISLPQMAGSIGLLLDEMSIQPDLIVGHSAGAALALLLCLERNWQTPVIGLNPALLPFPGLAAKLFPALAKMLFTNPFVPTIFARMARLRASVERFLEKSTGSEIDRAGVDYYHRLFARPGHCDGAIRMMASWRLEELEKRLSEVAAPVMLLHATKDTAIPRHTVEGAAKLIPGCTFEELSGLGHLAHEEQPEQIAGLISGFVAGLKG
jgi:magnesium chelatase accessory protein